MVPPASYFLTFSGKTTLAWNGVPGATAYDVAKGDLNVLRQSGSFAASQLGCLENDGADLVATDAAVPPHGIAYYYVVRSVAGIDN